VCPYLPAYGLLGFIKLVDCYYILLITQRYVPSSFLPSLPLSPYLLPPHSSSLPSLPPPFPPPLPGGKWAFWRETEFTGLRPWACFPSRRGEGREGGREGRRGERWRRSGRLLAERREGGREEGRERWAVIVTRIPSSP